jgi:hypothetical protein
MLGAAAVGGTQELIVSVAVFVCPNIAAEMVTEADAAFDTVIAKLAEIVPDGMRTLLGTVTAALSLEIATDAPP